MQLVRYQTNGIACQEGKKRQNASASGRIHTGRSLSRGEKASKCVAVLEAPGILERRARQSGRIQDRSGGRLAPGKSVVQFLSCTLTRFFSQPTRATSSFGSRGAALSASCPLALSRFSQAGLGPLCENRSAAPAASSLPRPQDALDAAAPGRRGWVGSPEGVGRDRRKSRPPPLAPAGSVQSGRRPQTLHFVSSLTKCMICMI